MSIFNLKEWFSNTKYIIELLILSERNLIKPLWQSRNNIYFWNSYNDKTNDDNYHDDVDDKTHSKVKV